MTPSSIQLLAEIKEAYEGYGTVEPARADKLLDAVEKEAWNAAMDHAEKYIIKPAENSARAALLAELEAGVEELPMTFGQHTCWDNHEGGADAEGNPTLHADGSACGDRIIGESVSRAAVLDILRKMAEHEDKQ